MGSCFVNNSTLYIAKILIFDEPAASLDPLTSKLIEDMILEVKDKTVITITHNWDEGYLSKFDRVIKVE